MLSTETAYNICRNDRNYKVRLFLYNGIAFNCIPINFNQSENTLEVVPLNKFGQPQKEEFHRRDTIVHYKELSPSNNIAHLSNLAYAGEHAKKLIIIGAGASYGYSDRLSEDRKKLCPPLANQIFGDHFDSILDKFPGAKNISTTAMHTEDIELFFQQQWDRISNRSNFDPATLTTLINTQYYLSSLFLRISDVQKGNRYNHFQSLIHDINKYLATGRSNSEKVLIVSFNYDLLIEEALSNFLGYSFDTVEDYTDFKQRDILLFKPHGSCNWFKKTMAGNVIHAFSNLPDAIEQYSANLLRKRISLGEIKKTIEDKIEVFNPHTFDPNDQEFGHFPELLIPYKDKDEFAMPTQHTQLLEYLLSAVEDVLIIGWKGTEASFQKLLKSKLEHKPINLYYANCDDYSIGSSYSNLLPKASIKNIDQYLSNSQITGSATFSNLIKLLVKQGIPFFERKQVEEGYDVS